MNIKTRNKRSAEFNNASMSDLVFLLLIFFMLLSTLVSPNAIKLLLPSSSSDRQIIEGKRIEVYIDENFQYYLKDVPVDNNGLKQGLTDGLYGSTESSVILRSDATVPIQFAVNVIDIVNGINKKYNAKHKVILATIPLE
ncbi:MAG: biopolymer transporter ExbD [Bacteroidales bacterium]|jgi:biopolymer transport protein ExbD|nr:biopolymer transporter ExbD [Bacteroidales bacterium]